MGPSTVNLASLAAHTHTNKKKPTVLASRTHIVNHNGLAGDDVIGHSLGAVSVSSRARSRRNQPGGHQSLPHSTRSSPSQRIEKQEEILKKPLKFQILLLRFIREPR